MFVLLHISLVVIFIIISQQQDRRLLYLWLRYAFYLGKRYRQ